MDCVVSPWTLCRGALHAIKRELSIIVTPIYLASDTGPRYPNKYFRSSLDLTLIDWPEMPGVKNGRTATKAGMGNMGDLLDGLS